MALADAAREHVRAEHRETVAAVLAAADAAAYGLARPAPREAVVGALEAALDEDVRGDLVALLEGAVAASGRKLPAEPVAAPPYLVVTARGPLVRGTLEGDRLVVLVRCFERAGGGYVPTGCDPDEAVEANVRRRP